MYNVTGVSNLKGNWYYAVLRVPDGRGGTKQISRALRIRKEEGKRAANRALKQLISEMESKHVPYSKDILFADWVEKWLEYRSNFVDEVTMQGYQKYAHLRILPFYRARKTRLQDMRPVDVQDFYNYCLADGLSPSSVRKYRAVVRGPLEWAYKQELIPDNPANRAEIPRSNDVRIGKAYTSEQGIALLEALKDESLYPAVFLAIHLGLRRSEICGLEWGAVNMDKREIYIRRTVTGVTATITKDKTKSHSSRRTLPMSDDVYNFFKRLRHRQMADRLWTKEPYQENDSVCKLPNGKPMSPDYVSATFRKMLKKHGMEHIRFHDLRHTAATLLLQQGVPMKVVQEWLGHSKMSTTADLYSHVDQSMKLEAASAVSRALCASS